MTRTQQAAPLARDLMRTKVVRLSASATIESAVSTLEEASISGAPVVDGSERLIGVFSVRDVARSEHLHEGRVEERAGDDRVPDWGDEDDDFVFEDEISDRDDYSSGTRGTQTVADWMNPSVISVAPEAHLKEVCGVMVDERIHRVFVVENGVLRGVISALDIVGWVAQGK